MRKILVEGIKPTDVEITGMAENYRLCLNTNAMKKQNLKIDRNLLFLMQHGEVR